MTDEAGGDQKLEAHGASGDGCGDELGRVRVGERSCGSHLGHPRVSRTKGEAQRSHVEGDVCSNSGLRTATMSTFQDGAGPDLQRG